MKKVMIGLLILIPIIILLIVALVTNIVSLTAHIAVDDMQLTYKGTQNIAYLISIPIDEGAICLYDFVDVKIYPEKATNKTVEWQIAGEIEYTDENYENDYNAYAKKIKALKDDLSKKFDNGVSFVGKEREAYEAVCREYYYDISEKEAIIDAMADVLYEDEKLSPAAVFVDDLGKEALTNTSGKMHIGSYCNFTVRAVAENVSKTISISVVGYDVEHVQLSFAEGDDGTLNVGKSVRLHASYTPIDSIVNHTRWTSSNPSIVKVDENGVVTAVGKGEAEIALEASVYSSESENKLTFVKSEPITINVLQNTASSIFGNIVVVAENKSSFSTKEIGLVSDEITNVKNGTYENGIITVEKYPVTVTLSGERQFSIESCRNGEIAIANSAFFVRDNGYVLSVGENSLKLTAVWADMLEAGSPDGVTWSSSDESIASVDANGNVVGVADGVVTIRAERDGEYAEIEINVRKKLSSIQLRTSDESLAIGLARETVFASERYIAIGINNAKVANSTYIVVQGEPTDGSADEIYAFYKSFTFEIIEGAQYASMDEDVANKIVFNSSSLEGKGKQKIVVRVKAKYPKYETNTSFTQEDVTLTAVYGVAVGNMDELKVATNDQKTYVMADENIVKLSNDEKRYWSTETESEVYIVNRNNHSINDYAIVLEENCMYEERRDEDGNAITSWIGWNECVAFYGNVYGNNKKISALNGAIANSDQYLVRIDWGGVTVSNLILRAGELDVDDDDENAEQAINFTGIVCLINAGWSRWFKDDGNDITFEYSIIENSNKAIEMYNTDITFKGCVIRNMAECGIYAPYRMNSTSGEVDETSGKQIVYPSYSHINLHNVICSNTLGSMMSVAYESVTMKNGAKYRFIDATKYSGLELTEEQIAQNKQWSLANEKFFIENFYNNDINMSVNQTGFLRAYNWMNVKDAGLIRTGIESFDSILGTAFGQIVEGDPQTFDKYLYKTDDEQYLHCAFIVTGLHFANGILDAPTYLKLNTQDDDYNCFNIQDVNFENVDLGWANGFKNTLSTMSLKIYGYNKEAEITPFSTYTLNSALIQELHQNN